MITDRYIFFWGGYCSQWYPSTILIDGQSFNCCEQWMMYNKAIMFGDDKSAARIMRLDNPEKQKDLGRKVLGFDDDVWMKSAYDIVVRGNRAKFKQDLILNNYLKSTGDKIIVEANPYDKRWGIGMYEGEEGIEDPTNWKGDNLLGKAIMQVRDDLFGT